MTGELPMGYVTPMELVVWRHVALGRITKEIAEELGISPKTIEKHRGELCRKLKARGVADLTRAAVKFGVIEIAVQPLTTETIERVRHVLPLP